jgi:hypothetical protein
MRLTPILISALLTSTLAQADPAEHSKLTLKNGQWERVTVQVVVAASQDCDAQGGRVSTRQYVLKRGLSKTIDVPNTPEARLSVCWRVDQVRNPDYSNTGRWSRWSKAILFPGLDTTTDL